MIMNNEGWTFKITAEEVEKIKTWKERHVKKYHKGNNYAGAIGGRFSYEFIPTSLGDIGVIKCSCGKEFEFKGI